jgi:uncharacterized protein YbbC (DUF1343 family)
LILDLNKQVPNFQLNTMPLKFGIDIILLNEPIWKKDRIAILTNDAARTNTGIISRLALKEAGFNLIKIFSPEHGINTIGEDGAKMHDGLDEITGLPVISLYGEKYMPTADDLNDIDVMLFDIPDAGTRFYTYLWSMTYWIEAAAEYNKQVIILDRPNPLSGNQSLIEGPMLDETISSFIGRFNIPVKHQCTLGELAIYFNSTHAWNANISIVQCEGWKREDLFYDWFLKWVNPSPALQNFEASLLYPGICFFEATNVSVGRGTPYSFEWIGAEWFNTNAVQLISQNLLKDDIKIESLPLTIVQNDTSILHKGIRIKIIDPKFYDAVFNGLFILKLIKDLHPKEFKWMPYPTAANPTGKNHLSLLLGIPNAEAIFDLPLQQWLQKMSAVIKAEQWKKEIQPFLMYSNL